MISTLQGREELVIVEALQHPSPDKPRVGEFYEKVYKKTHTFIFISPNGSVRTGNKVIRIQWDE